MRQIVQMGDPILDTPALEVSDPMSPEVTQIIKDLFEAAEATNGHAAGLAAPQIGYNKRITILRRFDLEKKNEVIWEVLINPKITYKSEELSTEWEGCLSIRNGDLYGRVERPRDIEVEFLDINGDLKKVEASDYQSHVFQHEIDHLDGKLFLRYIKDPSELYTGEELKKKESKEVADI